MGYEFANYIILKKLREKSHGQKKRVSNIVKKYFLNSILFILLALYFFFCSNFFFINVLISRYLHNGLGRCHFIYLFHIFLIYFQNLKVKTTKMKLNIEEC